MADTGPDTRDRRPSPDALLELAAREGRGRLKVFLGMAPGVGKTYAMLSAARAAKAEGLDVLVGVVETHGRSDTAALLDGLDVLPRKPVSYRGRTLMEFDVDAAVTRRPKLLLVDELAHSNPSDALHPKRYQDVEDVLRAGIDVWTTMNIQHLESLTDVVQKIAGIMVRETVPDTVLENAEEIVVIDLPPDELVKRLREGKVYLPENARRAIDKFFKISNLTALRELTLRRTADRVDEQMLEQLRQQGIEGPWPTSDRLLVCIGGDEHAETVVRAAARMATALKADWFAIHIRSPGVEVTDRKEQRRINKALQLAERLGARSARLAADDMAGEILGFARRNNVTQLIIGRSGADTVARLRGRSLPDALLRRADGLAVTVLSQPGDAPKRARIRWPDRRSLAFSALVATVAVGAAVVAGFAIERISRFPNISMIFLLAVIVAALLFGRWPAIAAAFLSFLAYNFFFIEPRWSFTIAEPHEVFALLVFLMVAVVTGTLAGRLREQASSTVERAAATQALLDFSGRLAAAASPEDVLIALASQASALIKSKAVVLLPGAADLELSASWPPEDRLSTPDWAAARWCLKEGRPAGHGTTTMPMARFQFRPLAAPDGPLGVLGVEPDEQGVDLAEATEAALQSLAEQASVALERTRLVAAAGRAETNAESERLRSALLSSISHDLRTPLASILGSVTSLKSLGDKMSAADRRELLTTMEEETERLSRFVGNILDMTKLEAGVLKFKLEAVDVRQVAENAIERARRARPQRAITIAAPDPAPSALADRTFLEQVLVNLLDNADKFSPPTSPTRVDIARGADAIVIAVTDAGIGIPKADLTRVFEKFYRVAGADGRAPGTGLGLSICAGLVTAMGGRIRAESPATDDRGTRILVELQAAPTTEAHG
jgi:two-component system, OmpR family, sensor histidine kinase KdpD